MGVRFPLPAPSKLFICSGLQGREASEAFPAVQIRYSEYLLYFQHFHCSKHPRFASTLYIVSFAYARLRSAQRIIGPPKAARVVVIYVVKRAMRNCSQDVDLIATTLRFAIAL
jgi:hypothetical protein